MSEIKTYPVSASVAEKALLNNENYLDWYSQSITDRENFWAERATEMIDWSKPWSKVVEENLAEGEVKWFIECRIAGQKAGWFCRCQCGHRASGQ